MSNYVKANYGYCLDHSRLQKLRRTFRCHNSILFQIPLDRFSRIKILNWAIKNPRRFASQGLFTFVP